MSFEIPFNIEPFDDFATRYHACKHIMFPWTKDTSAIVRKELDTRGDVLRNVLPFIFEIVYKDLRIPPEIINIIVEHMLVEETWAEIFKMLKFFYSKHYSEKVHKLLLQLADAQLSVRTSEDIQLMYFANCWITWRKTFDFRGRNTFAHCVEKRLKMIKTKEKHFYWVYHGKWENKRKHFSKQCELSDMERYVDVRIKTISNLKYGINLVEWIIKTIEKIVKTEKELIRTKLGKGVPDTTYFIRKPQ